MDERFAEEVLISAEAFLNLLLLLSLTSILSARSFWFLRFGRESNALHESLCLPLEFMVVSEHDPILV